MLRFAAVVLASWATCVGCGRNSEFGSSTRRDGDAGALSHSGEVQDTGIVASTGTASAVRGVVWKLGTTYQYELRSTTKMSLGRVPPAFDFELSARASILVVQQQGAREVLYLTVPDVTVKSRLTDAGLERTVSEVRGGSCLIFLSNGGLEKIGFLKGMTGSAATTYRQIASAIQMSRAPEGGQRYVAEEYDTTGRYAAEYILAQDPQIVKKAKLRYLALLGNPIMPDGLPLQLVPSVLRSEGYAVVSADGQLKELQQEEELAVNGVQTPVHSSTRFTLRLSNVSEGGPGADWRTLADAHNVVAASEPYGVKISQQALDHSRTNGASFGEIFARLAQNATKSASRATGGGKPGQEAAFKEEAQLFSALVGALREDPKAVDEAIQKIKAKSPLAPVLIDALSSASSAEAEKALVGLRSFVDKDPVQRARVLHALARMPRPGKDAVAVMKSVLEKEPYNPRALYALGTYSRRFRDEGNSEMAVGLGEYLVEMLREATGPSGRLTALRAIGNSGYSAALPDVRGFTSDKDETTRVVAVRALQSMKDLAVDEILTSTMGSDTSFEVRISAIEAARVRDPTDKLLLAVVAACRHPEPRIRYRAVETLIRWLPRRPSLRPVLQKISQEDPEQRVRDLARSG